MLNSIIGKKTVYIVTGCTDIRKEIDGLDAIVQGKLSLDPYSKALFLLSEQQLRWLLEELEIEQKKAIKSGKHDVLY